MKLVSLFAGIGGFDLGFDRAGFTTAGQCEIDPHAVRILERHWPDAQRHDDVSTLEGLQFGPADVVTFGSPCQDLSVAGKRAGLAGERSGLFQEAMRYIREMLEETDGVYPRCAIWENVPGAFSSNGGADFAAVLESMVGGEVRCPADGWAGAGAAFGPEGSAEWRVLDSQFFGVAQRRRRVFVIYYPGSDRAGQVLLEREGLRRDSEASSETREGTAAGATGGARGGSIPVLNDQGGERMGVSHGVVGTLRADPGGNHSIVPATSPTVTAKWAKGTGGPAGDEAQNLVTVAFKIRGGVETDSAGKGAGKGYLGSDEQAFTLGTGQDQHLAIPVPEVGAAYPLQDGVRLVKAQGGLGIGSETDPSYTLDTTGHQAVAFAQNQRDEVRDLGSTTGALQAEPGMKQQTFIAHPEAEARNYAVRRLTPTECERLQGFPDGWTAHTADGTTMADTNRYRMLGNAVTVNVAEWIGKRLEQYLAGEATA